MTKQKYIKVKSLKLDLRNFRALPQATEIDEIRTLISSAQDWFEGLLLDIAKNGYLSLENIGVLEQNGNKIVLEGNRRVSVFKILLGIVSYNEVGIKLGRRAQEAIEAITPEWIKANEKIPCTIFDNEDEEQLRHIIRRTHGVDEKGGRYTWSSISKARESRDIQHNDEPELDLLENLLRKGVHHTDVEQKKWLSNIKFSVFQEAARTIAALLGISSYDLRDRYAAQDLPDNIVDGLEKLVAQIGRNEVKFSDIRRGDKDFYKERGFRRLPETPGARFLSNNVKETVSQSEDQTQTVSQIESERTTSKKEKDVTTETSAAPIKKQNDPEPGTVRHCQRLLASLRFDNFPKAKSKMRLLQKELSEINSEKTPNAYAILFRAIVELAFYEYCEINHISSKDRLVEKIKASYNHLINQYQGSERTEKERDLNSAFSCLVDSSSCISTAALNVITHRRTSAAIPYNLRMGIYNAMPLLHEIGL